MIVPRRRFSLVTVPRRLRSRVVLLDAGSDPAYDMIPNRTHVIREL